ncbi:hypothetical protein Tco_0826197 [Tanacetum coccineum]
MPYPSRRYGVSVPTLTKDHKRNEDQYAISKRLYTPYSRYAYNIIFWKISNVVPTPRNPQYAIFKPLDTPLTEPTDDKKRELWVELKRLFEPYTDDELWKLQNHIHDLTWKLYDSCGVHHVSTKKGIDIYTLIEKEYPLSRGTLTLMLIAKLLVEQDNEMSRELLKKIFMQAKRPRR